MKQKCILSKKKNTLILKEVAQTEPGSFSLIYEVELENSDIEAAIEKGQAAVIDLFRSTHFYPATFFSERLADGIIGMFTTDPVDSLHIEFNDVESLQSTIDMKNKVESPDKEKELAEIDTLLDDDDAETETEAPVAVTKTDTPTPSSDTPAEEV